MEHIDPSAGSKLLQVGRSNLQHKSSTIMHQFETWQDKSLKLAHTSRDYNHQGNHVPEEDDDRARTGSSMLQVRDALVVQIPSDIPKIIHQSWKTADVPEAFQRWSQTWKDCLPGWEFKLHTDKDNRQIFANKFPKLLPTFDGYRHGVMRADASRLAYMATDGGLYADLDIECVKDPFTVVGQANSIVLACEGCRQISNAFMMGGESAKPFYRELLWKLPENANASGILEATGPLFITRKAEPMLGGGWRTKKGQKQHVTYEHDDVTVRGVVLDDSWIFGMPWNAENGTKQAALDRNWVLKHFPDSIAFSHWTNTWQGNAPPAVSTTFLDLNLQDQCECLLIIMSTKDAPTLPCQAFVHNGVLANSICKGRSCVKDLMYHYSEHCI